jgi:hypothetical protein
VALNQFIFGLIVAASFNLAPLRSSVATSHAAQAPKTVQISLDVDADVLVQDSNHQRIGVDLKTRKFVNEIPEARTIEREGSSTYVLPFDKSGKPYMVMIAGKSDTSANLSMTGPGFVVGARKLNLKPGEVEVVTFAANGTTVSVVPSRTGPPPQLFLTTQSDRTRPSYRFEVAASSLSQGKTMTLDLNLDAVLNFKSTDPNKGTLTITMRRTNPSGTRDTFSNRNVSFDGGNSYSIDFRNWDGKGDITFCRRISFDNERCTLLKNEAPSKQPTSKQPN